MDRNVKFTISLIQDAYTETVNVPEYEVLGTRKVEDYEVKERGGGFQKTIYGECIGYHEESEYHYSKVVGQYEQIPLMVGGMSFSVVNTSNQLEWYEQDRKVSSLISRMGKFCSIEKIYEFIQANQISNSPSYSLRYGYQYTDYDGKTKRSKDFETQEERDQSALKETGYDFDKLDWSDKIESSTVENSTSTGKGRR